MELNVAEILTPKKTLLGNSTWAMIHSAPYETIHEDELYQTETSVASALAKRFSTMVSGIVMAYPCGECRKNARRNRAVQELLEQLSDYAAAVEAGDDVADELAYFAFRLHNAVAATLPPTLDSRVAAAMEEAVMAGLADKEDVTELLRYRWDV